MAASGLLIYNAALGGHSRWEFAKRKPGSRPEGTEIRATRGWRTLRANSAYMAADPKNRVGGPFKELRLDNSRPLVPDLEYSVLLLPEMVTDEECQHLIKAADRWCADHAGEMLPPSARGRGGAETLTRVECHVDGLNLDGRAHALARIIIARALWAFESLRPDNAHRIFKQRASLGDMIATFSGHEPAINVYEAGGEFEPHEDKHMLTVLVPLSPLDAFKGG